MARRDPLLSLSMAGALALACVLAPAPRARAADVSLGFQTGMYRPQVPDPVDPNQTISDTSFFISPIFDFTFGRFGITTKYIYSTYAFQGIGSPETLPGGATSLNADAQKHDLDGALKYSLFLSDEFPFAVTPFAGIRYEIQNVTRSVPTSRGGQMEIGKVGFTITSIATGSTFSYTFRDLGLTPYIAGSAFVYSIVNPQSGTTLSTPNPNGFGGFALEGGVSYSLYSLLDAPVSFTASYRYQRIEPQDFKEELQQAIVGAFYHFVDIF